MGISGMSAGGTPGCGTKVTAILKIVVSHWILAVTRPRPVSASVQVFRMLLFALMAAMTSAMAEEVLTSGAAIRALTQEQAAAGLPVKINGVIIFANEGAVTLFLHDGKNGIFVELPPPSGPGDWPRTGDRVEVSGITGQGLFAPVIRGVDDKPATDLNKIWWVEAEMMAALTDALLHKENETYRTALDQLVHFVDTHQADPNDGIWLDTVTADGKPKSTGKAHSWKANYHDVRALVKFIEAFGAN